MQLNIKLYLAFNRLSFSPNNSIYLILERDITVVMAETVNLDDQVRQTLDF